MQSMRPAASRSEAACRRGGKRASAWACVVAMAGLSCIVESTAQSGAGPAGPGEIWRGIVKALHQPALSTDIATPIAAIGAREGEHFSQGSILIESDCRRQTHETNALAATVREAKTILDTNEHLVRRGASNRNDLEIARARHDKADADLQAMQQRLTNCRILAPFDGVVIELNATAHELPPPGKPLMIIASTAKLEIEIIVPSRRLARLKPGEDLVFVVDETSSRHRLRILRNGGAVDPVSQTVKIYAAFVDPPTGVLPGMSGTATFATDGN